MLNIAPMNLCFDLIYFDIHFNVGKYSHKCIIIIFYPKYTKLNSISRPTVVKYSDLATSGVETSNEKVWKN